MKHIPIIQTERRDHILEFSHFDYDAPAGQWKKENLLMLDSVKINLFIEGRFSVFSDGSLHYPVYGDICMFAPRKLHYGQISENTHVNYYQLDVGLRAFDAVPGGSILMERILDSAARRDSFIRPAPQNTRLVLALCKEIETGVRSENRALAYAKTIELLSFLVSLYSASSSVSGTTFSIHTSRTMRYIEKNYAETITIKTLSHMLNVSGSYLSRVFRQDTGTSIHEYLNQYRILKSSSLLDSHSITETGYLCGFNDTSHFISIFKKYMDKTPMQYKKGKEREESAEDAK